MKEHSSQVTYLVELVLEVRSFLKWVLLVAAIASFAAGVYGVVFMTVIYESEAIGLVRPQQPGQQALEAKAPPFLPQSLGVPDCVLLLTSEAVLAEVASAFNVYHTAGAAELQISAAELRDMVSAGSKLELKSPYTVSYYPTIEMRVRSSVPEKAYQLASIWVDIAKRRTHDITFSAKQQVLKYLVDEYESERKSLEVLAETINICKDESGELVEELKLAGSDLEEQYDVETLKLVQEASDRWDRKIAEQRAEFNLPLLSARIAAKTSELGGLQQALSLEKRRLAEARAKVKEIAEEKKHHPDLLVLGKAITDDALWAAELGKSEESEMERVDDLKLTSQVINPTAQKLSMELANQKVLVAAIPQQISDLESRISEVQETIDQLQADNFDKSAILTIMERANQSEVKTIEVVRKYGLESLKRRSALELDELERARKALEDQLGRDFTAEVGMFTSVADNRLQANLAVANTVDEFQIISGPTMPEERGKYLLVVCRILATFVAAFVIGWGACMAFAVFRKIVVAVQPQT